MILKNVNEISNTGRFHISTGITENDLIKIVQNPRTKSIQFSEPLSINEIDLLEKVIYSKRPEISLRIFGHYGSTCDLNVIERIPSLRSFSADCLIDAQGIELVTQLANLEHLGVGILNLDNFDFLDRISPNLTELYIHQTRSKKPKIDSISRFSQLEYLFLDGQQNGIEALSSLKRLQKVVLRSISTKDIDYLKYLENLWSVDVKLGGIRNFDALTTLPNLKYLELWQVRDLDDLSFISKLPILQNLFLQSLKQVKALPDFTHNQSLRRIFMENLKGLQDLSSLRNASALGEFIYISAQNQLPENMLPALENPNLKKILCMFGSNKKNHHFKELVKQYNKEEYQYEDFQYI